MTRQLTIDDVAAPRRTRKLCKNATCSAPSKNTYCSRRCQVQMRCRDNRMALPDTRVDMDLYRLLVERAHVLDITLRDLIHNIVEEAVDYTPAEEIVG